MPRAEVGSAKHLSNKMKSKGLQRLRWYCQICEKQCRDENGFKCHTQSEAHVRQMLLVGESPRKHIEQYSNQFKRDFLQLLRTSHGEKPVHSNHFYQEYIANKEHIHMNSTKWQSLTEFCKFLGRESICRVQENDKGLFISWIDNSPEALRRQAAIHKRDRQDRGDEEREQKAIKAQISRAIEDAQLQGTLNESTSEYRLERPSEDQPIKLMLPPNRKPVPVAAEAAYEAGQSLKVKEDLIAKPKNVFAITAKKRQQEGGDNRDAAKRPMSEAERIMKNEIERKDNINKDSRNKRIRLS